MQIFGTVSLILNPRFVDWVPFGRENADSGGMVTQQAAASNS